jgi:hypothetical protein
MAIRPVRLGILASIIAVVVFAVWLWRTDTAGDFNRQAWAKQFIYLREQRAASKGRSFEEMSLLAVAECMPEGDREPSETEWECLAKYLFGDGPHPAMPIFFIKVWALPLALLSLACAGIGVAVALIWKFLPLSVAAWWRWLTAK